MFKGCQIHTKTPKNFEGNDLDLAKQYRPKFSKSHVHDVLSLCGNRALMLLVR